MRYFFVVVTYAVVFFGFATQADVFASVSLDSKSIYGESYQVAKIYFDKPQYGDMNNETQAKIRLIEPDNNVDSNSIDNTSVLIFSDSDPQGQSVSVIETGKNTGIFEGNIKLTFDKTTEEQIYVSDGDTVTAEFVDLTLPFSYKGQKEITVTAFIEKIGSSVKRVSIPYDSPLKQFHSGILTKEIQCKDGLELAIKRSNSSPACVTHSTLEILKQRGWIANSTSNYTKPIINPPEIRKPAKNIVDSTNQFMLDYYSTTNTKDDNFFFSPWSILSAFSVLYEGAEGQTADEIAGIFYLPKDDSERRDSFGTMQNNLNVNGSGYELRNANALWIKHGFDVKDEFVNMSKQYYDSKVSEVNFPADESIVDSWVENQTNNKIKDLIKGKTDGGTELVITNAIYFKGTWQTQFESKNTKDRPFHVTSDKSVSVPMMNTQSKFAYAETDDLQIISMPYKGQKISMSVLLPKNNLESLEKSITVQKLEDWKKSLREQDVILSLPKFKLETEYDLADRKSTRLNSSHIQKSRMPSSA